MDLKSFLRKVQSMFDWIESLFDSIEVRWLVFLVTVFFIILFMAAGATGLAMLISLIYIMYFITLKL